MSSRKNDAGSRKTKDTSSALLKRLEKYEQSLTKGSSNSSPSIPVLGKQGDGHMSKDNSASSIGIESTRSNNSEPISSTDPALQKKIRESTDLVWAISQLIPREIIDPKTSEDTPPNMRVYFPLHFFDSDEHEPKTPQQWLAGGPIKAVGLPMNMNTGVVGRWSRCTVTSYDESLGQYVVSWAAGSISGPPLLHRVVLCFESEDRLRFAARLQQAYERRKASESLIQYCFYIKSIPTENAPRLNSEQMSRMLSYAVTDPGSTPSPCASILLEEVNEEYMWIMNKCIFDANRGDIETEFPDISLPSKDIVLKQEKAPYSGVITVPSYDFSKRFIATTSNSFLTLPAAVSALLEVKESCRTIDDHHLFGVDQATLDNSHAIGGQAVVAKSFSLEDFIGCQNQINHTTMKHLKEGWIQFMARQIRWHLSSLEVDGYKVDEMQREKYEGTPVQRYLKRINFLVADSLRDLIAKCLNEYVLFMEKCASTKVTISKDSSILLEYQIQGKKEDYDLETYVRLQKNAELSNPPPLFRLELMISEKEVMLNRNKVEAREKEIAAWQKENVGVSLAECPVEPVEPIMGFVFEYNTPLNEFPEQVLEQCDATLVRLTTLDLVERAVMDRLFWPDQDSVKCVGSDVSWVADLRTRLTKCIEQALSPLKEYLVKFDEHIDLLNLNVTDYLSSIMKQPEPKADDDDQEETVVAPMELNELRRTVVKHMEAEKVLNRVLPLHPVNLGMFVVDLSSTKKLLSRKHTDIVRKLLTAHMDYCDASI